VQRRMLLEVVREVFHLHFLRTSKSMSDHTLSCVAARQSGSSPSVSDNGMSWLVLERDEDTALIAAYMLHLQLSCVKNTASAIDTGASFVKDRCGTSRLTTNAQGRAYRPEGAVVEELVRAQVLLRRVDGADDDAGEGAADAGGHQGDQHSEALPADRGAVRGVRQQRRVLAPRRHARHLVIQHDSSA